MVLQKFPILQKWKQGQKDFVTHHEPQLVYKGNGINTRAVFLPPQNPCPIHYIILFP